MSKFNDFKGRLSTLIQRRGGHYVWMVTDYHKSTVYARGTAHKRTEAQARAAIAKEEVRQQLSQKEAA